MIHAVFFDLYGTLVDVQTNEQDLPPYERLAEWLADRKLKASPAALQKAYQDGSARARSALNDPDGEIDVAQVFKGVLSEIGVARPTAKQVEECALAFRRSTRTKLAPVAGANDLLQKLRPDYRLGLLANAQKLYIRPELEELRMFELFESMTLSSDTGYRKPSSRIFEVALQTMEVAPDEAVYVGSSPKEGVATAKQVGLRVLYFCPAGSFETVSPEPDGKVRRLAEVSRHLEEWHEPIESDLVDETLDDEE
jgi:putative hydrolase of the HAD superfamily